MSGMGLGVAKTGNHISTATISMMMACVIIGRKISEEKEGLFHMIGFMILMVFMVVVLFNDIMRVFGG